MMISLTLIKLVGLIVVMVYSAAVAAAPNRIGADSKTSTSNNGDLRSLAHSTKRASVQMALSEDSRHGYGVDLPSFAFDYSEFFVSATVSRQRYLTIVMIGHRIIYEDYPIEAISTEYENLEHWHQATKFWTKPKKYNVRPKLQQMFCVIHNHNDPSMVPYQVPATWLRVSSKTLNETGMHSNFNRHIEMLRCPLHHLSKQNPIHVDLDVDIYRKGGGHILTDHPTSHSADKVHLISFSVPWERSYRGYPNIPQFKAASLLPITAERLQDSILNAPPDSTEMAPTVSSKPITIVACIPGIRLSHIRRSETGWAMLLEFISHLFLHGADQIILGVAVAETSSHFLVAQTLLNTLYPQQTVLLVPTAVPHYDDVPGFSGVQLSDNFADVFFLNHCLYLLKGKEISGGSGSGGGGGGGAKFMLVMRVNQLLVPTHAKQTLRSMLQSMTADELTEAGHRRGSTVTGAFIGSATSGGGGGADHGHGNRHHLGRVKDMATSAHAAAAAAAAAAPVNTPATVRRQLQQSSSVDSTAVGSTEGLGGRSTAAMAPQLRGKRDKSGAASATSGHSPGHNHRPHHPRRPATDAGSSLSRFCSIRLASPTTQQEGQYVFVSDPLTVFDDNGPGQFQFSRDFFNDSVPRAMKVSTSAADPTSFPWRVSLINIDKAVAIDVHTTEQLLQQYTRGSAQQSPTGGSSGGNSQIHSDLSASHAVVYPICGAAVASSSSAASSASSSSPSSSSPSPSSSSSGAAIEHGDVNATWFQVATFVPPAYPQDHLEDLAPSTLPIVQEHLSQTFQRLHAELQDTCGRLTIAKPLPSPNTMTAEAAAAQLLATTAASNTLLDYDVVNLIRPVCSNAKALRAVIDHIKEERHKAVQEQRQADALNSLTDQIDTVVAEKSRKDVVAPFWQLCNTAHLSEILRKIFVSAT